MDAELRNALTAIVGAKGVTDAGAVSPSSAGEVAGILRACSEHGARVAVVSGAAPRGAEPPPRAAVLLSVGRLSGVSVHVGASIARAEPGATVTALRSACAAADLALVAPAVTRSPSAAHVGSLIARGGVPRRALCGIEAVLGTGEVIRAGGLVQRDVTGYDLIAVLLGSAGRLAVITSAWFRLQPASVALGPHEPRGTVELGAAGEAVRAAFDPGSVLIGT
jgi:FAD/FMN-containing dehydrogenase